MRRTFFTFSAFIAVVFIAVGTAFSVLTNTLLKSSLRTICERDLAMMEVTTQGDLAVRDYEKIEERVLLWGEQDPNIVRLRYVLDTDTVLVEYQRGGAPNDVLGIVRKMNSSIGRSVTLELEYDLSNYTRQTRALALVFAAFGILGALIFITALWRILQRMAIIPMQTEIEERRRAESDLARSKDFLQTVIDGFPEILMVINTDHTIALANKSAAVMAGKESSELVGLTCFGISHNLLEPCDGEDHPCSMREVLATKTPVSHEHVHIDGDGGERHVEIVAAPIFDDKRDVVQVIESYRDVTERKTAENAKLHLERQMQYAQKLESLGVLAGGIAHDFNNILMGVLGNAELAMHRLSPEDPVRKNIERIETAAERAADLAKQMLAYSGKGSFVVEQVDVNSTVKEMAHLLKATTSKTSRLSFDLAENLPPILADITQVRQVFMNLITNASEALEGEIGDIAVRTGTIELTGDDLAEMMAHEDAAAGLFTYIEVSDTGCGMDKLTQARVFDPFFTTKFTGRGLGMAATLGIIRGHHGAIDLSSEPARGTTVRTLFPARRDLPQDILIDDGPSSTVEDSQGGATILVVDDEETVCALAKRALTDVGFDVFVAEDGTAALKIFAEHHEAISLVLLDMTMPRMSGEETYTEMQKIRGDVRVVLSSGFNERDATKRFAGKPLAGFIQKPYKPTELVRLLRALLAGATHP